MENAYIVTGTLTDEHTVTLDEALPLARIKVRLVVEPLSSRPQGLYQEVVSSIRARQRARDHQARTREAVDAYLTEERNRWEE